MRIREIGMGSEIRGRGWRFVRDDETTDCLYPSPERRVNIGQDVAIYTAWRLAPNPYET